MKIALIHRYYSLKGAITPIVDASIKEYKRQNIDYALFSENLKGNEKTKPFLNAIKFYLNTLFEIRRKEFDLVLTHSYPVCFLRLFLKQPIILFIHNTGREESKGQKRSLYSKISAFFRALSFKFADKIIAVSDLVREVLIEEYNLDPKKIVTIYNGINAQLFRKINKINRRDKFIVLHRGTDTRKGFDLLIKWSEEIIKENPHVYFLILGKSPANFSDNISKHFKFIEWVDYKKMPEIYSSSDLVICPARYDPFPGVAIEAMSCEKPVLMSNMCGTKALVKQSKNGFVCDLQDFKEEIIRVSNINKKELNNIGRNARKTIMDSLNWQNIIKKQKKMFEETIAGMNN